MKSLNLNEACDICGGNEYSVAFENKFEYPYDLVECVQCRLLTIHPKIAENEVASLYNTPAHTADPLPQRDVHKANKRIQNLQGTLGKSILHAKGYYKNEPLKWHERMAGLLLKNVMHKKILDYHTGGKILDIGCNNGLFLHILKNIGWDVSGVEVNAQAAKAANSLGLNCFCGYLADAKYPDHTFDVVRVYHVLEHVYSPWELLVEIKRILKPGGCVYLEIPNQRSFSFFILKHVWHGREGHLYAFSPATFQKLCDKAGFRVEKSSVQSSVAKFCADLKIWSQYKGGWANAIYPKLVSNKMLKTMLIKPFFAIIDLIGLGDKYAVQLSLKP